MNKSQNLLRFLFLFLSILLIFTPYGSLKATPKESHALADSLFEAKMYTQSYEIYENIFLSKKKSSRAMLLKMAFIKEGLEEYSEALYFLNLYYKKTYNKRVLKKMEDLAEAHQLTGYEYDDAEFFLNLYHHFYNHIIITLMLITLFIFSLILYYKQQTKKTPVLSSVIFTIFLIALIYANNFGREYPKAIIEQDHAYLMDGPSAGADVIDIVDKGHRVEVLKSNDIWSKISWKAHIVYIRKNSLKMLDY